MVRRRVIGLTGGIATGKSTVAVFLQETYGFAVLDADVYAREAVMPGSEVLQAIARRYGSEVLQADGTLDRARLGAIVFGNPRERQWLEGRIHPFVRQRFVAEIERREETVVLVVPLLFEANMTDLATEIWVVACSPEEQLARLRQRNGYSEEEARSRIEAQLPLAYKCQQADLVLDNSGDRRVWQQQIDRWLRDDLRGLEAIAPRV
ncbi:Dephospho-CoA kinase [Geitlerinema sp. FC II]|nr:dephospho-CoA kinase [Geitlerinema sp. CS-897]PPT07865.1 Dephospho-CoA kinase [Geitlerinema sp. FC II]